MLVQLGGLIDVGGVQARVFGLDAVEGEDLANGAAVDPGLVTQLVNGAACQIGVDQPLGLLGVELTGRARRATLALRGFRGFGLRELLQQYRQGADLGFPVVACSPHLHYDCEGQARFSSGPHGRI